MTRYVVASSKPWFEHSEKSSEFRALDITYLSSREELTVKNLREINPRYVFFPHWNWIVPDLILDSWECVCFHAAPVPFGRGGSPVQNMITRGFDTTELTAFRMVAELDAGPVYLRREVSLAGTVEEIFLRLGRDAAQMIVDIARDTPQPVEQSGEVVLFRRRNQSQSELPRRASLTQVFDHIRMLDGLDYPPAFIDYGEFRIEFSRASRRLDHLEASVTIRQREKPAE